MSLLTPEELVELRRNMAAGQPIVTWIKSQINVALQAIEDWFEANKANLGAAIETAAPGTFNVIQKKRLVAFWLRQKFRREGVE